MGRRGEEGEEEEVLVVAVVEQEELAKFLRSHQIYSRNILGR
jgi:hypothetical protein